jgi:hypothetical protein
MSRKLGLTAGELTYPWASRTLKFDSKKPANSNADLRPYGLCADLCARVRGERRADAWLRYDSLRTAAPALPNLIAIVGNGVALGSAAAELSRALGEGNSKAGLAAGIPSKDAFVLGRWKDVHALFPELRPSRAPVGDAETMSSCVKSEADSSRRKLVRTFFSWPESAVRFDENTITHPD